MNPTDRTLTEQNFLFRGMDLTSVEYLLGRSTVQTLAAGAKLLQPDMPNHHLHLILEGKLSVYLAAHETLEYTSLLAGECAGEISLVDGKPPSALVVAAEPTRILSIPHDTVWSLADHSHEIARNLLGIIAGRMRNDNIALIATQNRKTQFEHQAYVDALTGIYNRHWMGNAFPRTLHRCALDKQPIAVMVADIDHFKQVNDTHGHLVGDLALKVVARCMAENLRPHDLLARYGGEEFAVLLPDADLEEATAIAERLRALIADTEICCEGVSFRVTISIGIAPTRHEKTLENLIREADQALYRAKRLGRNRVEVSGQPS
jgi:diguanylate cyclase (GGDEF)-like protein